MGWDFSVRLSRRHMDISCKLLSSLLLVVVVVTVFSEVSMSGSASSLAEKYIPELGGEICHVVNYSVVF